MKRLLIAFTAAAALAGPLAASAQDRGQHDHGGPGAQAAAPAAPQAPAANQGRGGGGWQGRGQGGGGNFAGGNQGWRGRGGGQAQAAPQAPQVQPQARGPNNQFRGGDNYRGGGYQQRNDNRYADQRRGGWQGQRYADNRGGYSRYRAAPFRWPAGYGYRRWGVNEYLPRIFLGGSYFIGDYGAIGLPYAPPGEQWVRVGNDALLVDVYSGQILDVVPDVFYW